MSRYAKEGLKKVTITNHANGKKAYGFYTGEPVKAMEEILSALNISWDKNVTSENAGFVDSPSYWAWDKNNFYEIIFHGIGQL